MKNIQNKRAQKAIAAISDAAEEGKWALSDDKEKQAAYIEAIGEASRIVSTIFNK